jgi:H+/gluconate symporter-like permease
VTRGIAVEAVTSPLVSWGAFFGNADLVTAYVAIITAVITGVWGIKKYLDERRSAREQQKKLAETELEQRKDEAREARQQRAAELIKAVGDATDPRSRRWTMSALPLSG